MRRQLIVFATLFLLINEFGYTQENRKTLFRIGTRAGYNISNLDFTGNNLPSTKNIGGVNFGGVIETPIIPLLNIQGALLFSQKGSKVSQFNNTTEFRPNYLEIPVIARLKPKINENLKMYAGVGAFYAVKLDGDNSDDLANSDVGFCFQAGIEVGKFTDFEFTYDYGTKNISDKNFEVNSRTFSLNVVFYLFNLKRKN